MCLVLSERQRIHGGEGGRSHEVPCHSAVVIAGLGVPRVLSQAAATASHRDREGHGHGHAYHLHRYRPQKPPAHHVHVHGHGHGYCFPLEPDLEDGAGLHEELHEWFEEVSWR